MEAYADRLDVDKIREAYDTPAKQVNHKRQERERQAAAMQHPLGEALEEAGIPAEVVGRPKHLGSISESRSPPDMPRLRRVG